MPNHTNFQRHLNGLSFKLKTQFKKLYIILLKCLGFSLLNREQTIKFLKYYLIKAQPENRIVLPDVENSAVTGTFTFRQREAITDYAYVWRYNNADQKATQLRNGAILIHSKVLCTDFYQSGFYKAMLKRNKRSHQVVKTLIAPWSQYLDGRAFGGYYDFVLLVAAKLCRMKDALPDNEFSETAVCYPLFGMPYEPEYMALLDIKSTQLIDSRFCKVRFGNVILGNSGHWFYPNLADILSLKSHVESKLRLSQTHQNRIYVSRSGRRHVENEKELIDLLKKFDFIVIEDKQRSVEEQVEIYKNASFILGPHGASFTNIIWCEPGSHLFELFSPNYIRDHFLYLSRIMGMKYSAYSNYTAVENQQTNYRQGENIFVSIPELDRCLTGLLNS